MNEVLSKTEYKPTYGHTLWLFRQLFIFWNVAHF